MSFAVRLHCHQRLEKERAYSMSSEIEAVLSISRLNGRETSGLISQLHSRTLLNETKMYISFPCFQ